MSKEQNTQLAKNKSNADMYLPSTKGEAYKLAESFSQSAFCPAAYRGKPAEVYLAMAYGSQIGLNPLLAVQNIAVVNGKPSVYGDALTAIAQGHHETESYEDGYLKDGTAYCRIVRKGRTIYREFSVEMAKVAGLWGQNTWKKYPQRMLLWRARGWAIRDAFADVLMGLWSVEEAMDTPRVPEDRNVTPEPDMTVSEETPETSDKAGSIKNKIKKQAAPEPEEPEDIPEESRDLTPPELMEDEDEDQADDDYYAEDEDLPFAFDPETGEVIE